MSFSSALKEQRTAIVSSARWLLFVIPLGILTGSACALFLWSLDRVTVLQTSHDWMLYLLPAAGAGVVWIYQVTGKNSDAGNNLIIDEIHQPGGGVPFRMAPLVLFGTLVTHLFGGSAGREGTAVQMGGSIAAGLGRFIPGLPAEQLRILLMAGVAAGFGGVFGTPVAGTVFALEVLTLGRMSYSALVPCFLASVISDQVCLAWGIEHTHYAVTTGTGDTAALLTTVKVQWILWSVVLGMVAGWVGTLFAEFTHRLKAFWASAIKWPLLRPVCGGLVVIGLTLLIGSRDYLGLGVSSANPEAVTIVSCFRPGGANHESWFLKLVLTAVTVSCGFKGGEVTPLFFIGAALGNSFASLLGLPVDVFAAIGLTAVFAGATNTPLACILLGIELFGGSLTINFAAACISAYSFSGHTGIYTSQRRNQSKHHGSE